jgi:hypothetical protein
MVGIDERISGSEFFSTPELQQLHSWRKPTARPDSQFKGVTEKGEQRGASPEYTLHGGCGAAAAIPDRYPPNSRANCQNFGSKLPFSFNLP